MKPISLWQVSKMAHIKVVNRMSGLATLNNYEYRLIASAVAREVKRRSKRKR